MQQDRLLGAAGEGRYGAVRGWAGRPEYGNSLLVREPLAATDVDRLDLGLEPVGTPGDRRAARRLVGPRRRHPPPPPGPDEAQRDEQTAALLDWLDGAAGADATILMGDFNADPAEPSPARLRAAGFRSAYAEANGAEPAVTWPSGLQAPAMDTDGDPECLDYIWVRGAVRVDVGPARLRPAGPRGPDALPERSPRDRRHARDRRSGIRGVLGRFASRIAATGARRPRTRSRRSPRRSRSRPATVWSSTSAVSADGVPVVYHDETLERLHGRPDRVDALTVDALDGARHPDPGRRPARGRPARLPRRRAEGRSGAGRRRGCWPPAAVPA